MDGYTHEQFRRDLENPNLVHLNSREHFKAFYEELGKMPEQEKQCYLRERMDFVKPEGRLLELGCHNGFNLVHYALQGFNITGVDVSETLIAAARQRMNASHPYVKKKIKLFCGFIEDFESDELYDTIIITEVLEHCIDPLAILKKAKTLLARGGKIYITSPSSKWGNSSHVRGVSPAQLREWLEAVGLNVELCEDIGGLTRAIAKL